ncbi:hypothetical protein D3C80_1625270 [compost metagenome]
MLSTEKEKPTPKPVSSMKRFSISREVSGDNVLRQNTPARKHTAESSIMLRKLVLVVSSPPVWLPSTVPIIIGIRISPELVAEPPLTPCTKIGM